MCNSCAKVVQTMSKSSGHEHILCADSTTRYSIGGQNHHSSTFYPQFDTPTFSTTMNTDLHPLGGSFPRYTQGL